MIQNELQNWSSINPFVPNALFLYPLKTSFQRVEKGCIGNKWVNAELIIAALKFVISKTLF